MENGIQPNIPPVSPPPPVQPTIDTTPLVIAEKPKRNKSVLVTMLILVLVILGVAGCYGYSNYLLRSKGTVPIPSPNPPVRPTDIPSQSEVTNNNLDSIPTISYSTKRYEGKRLGFDYPSSWILKTTPSLSLESPDKEFYAITFAYLDFTDFKEEVNFTGYQNCTEMTIDSKKARRCSSKQDAELGIAETYYDLVSIEQVIGVYSVGGMANNIESLEKNKKIFDQIINSIKFKDFSTTGCGGIDSQGELLCECSGNYAKAMPPLTGLQGDPRPLIGSHTCFGTCGKCCYTGSVKQSEFPTCK